MTTTTASDALPRQLLLPRTTSDLPGLTRLAAMTLPQLPAAVIALRDPPRTAPTIRYDDVEYPGDVIADRGTSDAEPYDTIFVAMSRLAPIEILATTRATMLLPASLLALQRETASLKDPTDRVVTVQEASRDIVPTAVLAVESPVTFEADEERLNPLQGHRVAIADSRLEELRGGFETDSGLKISFGIERAVYINGNLVTSTSLNVADLSRLTAGQAVSASLDRASLGIIQSGPNNAIGSNQFNSSSMATVIQNTLNGQKIQGITQINATVNSLDLLRKSSLQQSIQSALTDSIRH